jgi:hypothetical protein
MTVHRKSKLAQTLDHSLRLGDYEHKVFAVLKLNIKLLTVVIEHPSNSHDRCQSLAADMHI